jgi:hypothetical protein
MNPPRKILPSCDRSRRVPAPVIRIAALADDSRGWRWEKVCVPGFCNGQLPLGTQTDMPTRMEASRSWEDSEFCLIQTSALCNFKVKFRPAGGFAAAALRIVPRSSDRRTSRGRVRLLVAISIGMLGRVCHASFQFPRCLSCTEKRFREAAARVQHELASVSRGVEGIPTNELGRKIGKFSCLTLVGRFRDLLYNMQCRNLPICNVVVTRAGRVFCRSSRFRVSAGCGNPADGTVH